MRLRHVSTDTTAACSPIPLSLAVELQVLVRKRPFHQCWALGRCQTHVCGLAPVAALQFDVHHTELVQSTLVQRALE